MADVYEVVIAGGGHNALCVAAYLARAGVSVCVVESNAFVGGGAVTREVIAPGFKTDICSLIHVFIQANPVITDDELGLIERYGLKYIYPEVPIAVHFNDGTHLSFYRDLEKMAGSIARFSRKDADAYVRFHDWSSKLLNLLLVGMFSPTPSFGGFVSMMDQSHEGRELLHAMMVSTFDIINEWFENEKVKIALTRWISECMIMPQTKGTGIGLFVMIPLFHKFGAGLAVGGSGALSESLERCVLDLGGEVRTSSSIKSFNLESGTCTGVTLENGKEIKATRAVVASLNIRQIFPDMVSGARLPEGFLKNIEKLRFSDYQGVNQGFALHDAPAYKNEALNEAFFIEFAPDTLEEYLRYFNDLSFGVKTYNHNPGVACATIHDPTRAPEGKHTFYMYDFAPYNLNTGGPAAWDSIKEEYADEVLDFFRRYVTNMGEDNIIGRWMQTPVDLERFNQAFMNGDFAQVGAYLHQNMGNRPLPGWNYRTPIDKLYLCGPGTHPGLGVTGGGRAAVQVVMEDLGIDFSGLF